MINSQTNIHPTALVHANAKLGENVQVGAYSIIGPEVEIGDNTWIGPHVVIQGPARIGRDNKFFQFSSIGEAPQDLKYRGERTFLIMGDRNIVREFCTFNRGTAQDHSTTRIGNDNLFMAYVHIAHDCIIGNHVIFANNASLAGHVVVEDFASLSGFSGVFQFCRIGAYSFATTNSVIIKDVPPYVKVSGYYAKPFGLNTIGLQRRGFDAEVIKDLRRAYRIVYRNGLTTNQALDELKKFDSTPIKKFVDFIETSNTGIVR